jgi:hypothetical protein
LIVRPSNVLRKIPMPSLLLDEVSKSAFWQHLHSCLITLRVAQNSTGFVPFSRGGC